RGAAGVAGRAAARAGGAPGMPGRERDPCGHSGVDRRDGPGHHRRHRRTGAVGAARGAHPGPPRDHDPGSGLPVTVRAECSGCRRTLRGPYTGHLWLCPECKGSPRALPEPPCAIPLALALGLVVMAGAATLAAVVTYHVYTRLIGDPQ